MSAATDTPILTRHGHLGLAEQLAQHLAERIRQGLILPGARLPSVRECARRYQISPHTVVAAYDQLSAAGWVEARRQRGFFVRGASEAASTNPPRQPATNSPRRIPADASALVRGMLGRPGRPSGPGIGTLPTHWLDALPLHAALRKVLADDSSDDPGLLSLEYGEPAGEPRLREALARLIGEFGVRADSTQIVTTTGATQALDLVARVLLRPGEAVLVDDPGWSVEHARLSHLGMQLLPVPRRADGPDLTVMETLIRSHRPRLYVTVSVLHNPTGGMIDLACAHRLLQLAERHDLAIVEDDSYAHLAPAHAPRLSALDGLRRTFYVGGFSKILAPGWRIGFVAAPATQAERLIDMKMLASLTTPTLLERAMALCLEQGQLRRHADRLVARLDAARQRSVRCAMDAGLRFASAPQGLFGWVDTGVDSERLAQRLLDAGWLTAPGPLFLVRRQPSAMMRLNFAASDDPAFWATYRRVRDSMDLA